MNTIDNPGSQVPYRFKSFREVASSTMARVRNGEFKGAFNFLVTEFLNATNKGKILDKQGKLYCPLCENHSGAFIHLSNSFRFSFNSVCPYCSSRARHRGLSIYYKELTKSLNANHKILHFAPEPVFYSIFKNKEFTYQTTDYILKDVDLPKQDVQNLNIADDTYDVILTNHVIEHVPDDVKALKEMCRVLKRGGKCIITVPGNYNNAHTVYFKDLKNNGHYRDYGMDFQTKMQQAFSTVEAIDLHVLDTTGTMSIPKKELLFVGVK